MKLDISLRAPAVFLPSPNLLTSALMIDFGNLYLQNEANELEKDLVIDQFSITIEKFKVSR